MIGRILKHIPGMRALRMRGVRRAVRKQVDEGEWKSKLTPQQYHVLRECGTEPAFTGKYVHEKTKGTYTCAACGQELFKSETKYESVTGWPSFYDAINQDKIRLTRDNTHGMQRTEVSCNRCGSHLGHLFNDGPKPTNQRYCINSTALNLKEESK